jgi:hypothetical protein
MKIAIMQPYFFPYLGYFQLMNAVDEFVVYDNIQFTKKGWIQRNRILNKGTAHYFTIPLKKDSDYKDVRERFVADDWPRERRKLLNKIHAYYNQAPFFENTYAMVESCMNQEETNLFNLLWYSLIRVKEHLRIPTNMVVSSSIPIDHSLKSEFRVIAISKARKASEYINPIGGISLYRREVFEKEGLSLSFLRKNDIHYKQFGHEFIDNLSIIDVLMFNTVDRISEFMLCYSLE